MVVGVNLLIFLYRNHFEGALLTDDGKKTMGQLKGDLQTIFAYLIKVNPFFSSMVYGSRNHVDEHDLSSLLASSTNADIVESGL